MASWPMWLEDMEATRSSTERLMVAVTRGGSVKRKAQRPGAYKWTK